MTQKKPCGREGYPSGLPSDTRPPLKKWSFSVEGAGQEPYPAFGRPDFFVRERKDLFITGSAGTGKSYLATAFGFQACQKGYKVLYANTSRLMGMLTGLPRQKVQSLQELRKSKGWICLYWMILVYNLSIPQGRMNLMDIIEDRHGKNLLIITSQVPVKKTGMTLLEKRRLPMPFWTELCIRPYALNSSRVAAEM